MSVFLVTGGAGFIGSNIVDHLLKKGEQVRVLDNFVTGRKNNLTPFLEHIHLIEGDIRDKAAVREALEGVDFVLHQAALGSIARSIADPSETNSCNVDGTLNLLIESKACGVKRFVYASSSSVYGNSHEMCKVETLTPNPCSPYGVSKLVGEMYCRVFHEIYGIETVILRYFNVFGRRQDPDSQYAAVIPRFITALQSGKAPVIYGDGNQTRDFTFVENVVQANMKACLPDFAIFGEAFNIACGGQTSVNDLHGILSALTGKDILPVHVEGRKGEVKHSYAHIEKARSILGYAPQFDLKSGLEQTVRWYETSGACSH